MFYLEFSGGGVPFSESNSILECLGTRLSPKATFCIVRTRMKRPWQNWRKLMAKTLLFWNLELNCSIVWIASKKHMTSIGNILIDSYSVSTMLPPPFPLYNFYTHFLVFFVVISMTNLKIYVVQICWPPLQNLKNLERTKAQLHLGWTLMSSCSIRPVIWSLARSMKRHPIYCNKPKSAASRRWRRMASLKKRFRTKWSRLRRKRSFFIAS